MLTWFKDCRRTYNQALNVALDNGWHKDPSEFNYRELEKRFVAAAGVTDKTVLRTPKAPRQQALKSLHSDFKRHATNLKQHQAKLKAHKTKFKKDGNYSSREPKNPVFLPKPKVKYLCAGTSDSIQIDRACLRCHDHNRIAIYPTWNPAQQQRIMACRKPLSDIGQVFANVDMVDALPDNPFAHDVKIHYDGLEFFLVLTHERKRGERKVVLERDELCAIDPGVRKFATTYSPQGVSEIIGTNTKKVTAKLERRIQRQKHRLKGFDATLDDFKYEFGWSRKVRRIW